LESCAQTLDSDARANLTATLRDTESLRIYTVKTMAYTTPAQFIAET
jgi:hypothetical protein